MDKKRLLTFYSNEPKKYEQILEKLRMDGYRILISTNLDNFTLDPSLRVHNSGNLHQGETNLAHFLIRAEQEIS